MSFFDDLIFAWPTFMWGIETFLSVFLISSIVATFFMLPILTLTVRKQELGSVFGALLVIALFGALVGFHGGNSRVGVVGDLIPAVVTLVAGFAMYLFGLPDKNPGPYMFPLLGSFIVTLFICWSVGAANNAGNEQHAAWEKQCLSVFGNPDILASATAYQNAKSEFGDYCDGAFE